MSVINKMLQDLETRESQASVVNADYQPPDKKPSKMRVILLLVIAVAAIAYGLFSNTSYVFHDTRTQPQQDNDSSIATTPVIKTMKSVELKTKPKTQAAEVVLVENVGIIQQPVEQSRQQTEAEQGRQVVVAETHVQANNGLDSTAGNEQIAEQVVAEMVPERQPATFSMSGSALDKSLLELKQNISENLATDNLGQASLQLEQLLQYEPDNIKARKKLASLKFSQGNNVQAKLLLTNGITMFPARSDFRLMLARMYVGQKQLKQAIALLREFEPIVDTEEFYAYRAGLARQLKQFDLAKTDYLNLTSLAPNNGKWWLGLAIMEDQAGNSSAALSAYAKVKQSNQLENAVNDFVEQRINILLEAQ